MAPPRLPVFDPSRQSEADPFSDMHRSGCLAWDELTHGYGPTFAQALHTSQDIVNKMGQPAKPHRPPNLQLAYAMLRALELRLPEARVLSPLRWLNATFRQLCYAMPEAGGQRAAALNLLVAHTTKELNDYAHAVAAVVASPEGVQDSALPVLKRELDEAVRAALEMQESLSRLCQERRLAGARLVNGGVIEEGGSR